MGKTVIIAIVGKSGSGKTTLAKHLEIELRIPTIVSYTTRKMRDDEENGVDHIFVSEFPYSKDDGEILAWTNFGGHDYWTTHSQVSRNDVCTYVIDEKGLVEMKNKYGEIYDIISVYVDCPKEKRSQWTSADRMNRDLGRISIDAKDYNCIINNNSDLLSLFRLAEERIIPLVRTIQNR